MHDSEELEQLVHLMRLSGDTARNIAVGQRVDVKRILMVAHLADAMAAELEEICRIANNLAVPGLKTRKKY